MGAAAAQQLWQHVRVWSLRRVLPTDGLIDLGTRASRYDYPMWVRLEQRGKRLAAWVEQILTCTPPKRAYKLGVAGSNAKVYIFGAESEIEQHVGLVSLRGRTAVFAELGEISALIIET